MPIRSKLNDFKSLSVSQLVNQSETVKYKFSIFSVNNAMKKGILNIFLTKRVDINQIEADLTQFNTM